MTEVHHAADLISIVDHDELDDALFVIRQVSVDVKWPSEKCRAALFPIQLRMPVPW
jgi:hypothetical protein